MDNQGADRPPTNAMEDDASEGTGKGSWQRQRRRPYNWRWPLGLGCTALFIIGMSLLYWYQVPDRGLAKTEALPISADPAPTGPGPSGSTVRVLVDARLETVLVEFRPQSGQTPSNFSPARSSQRGDVRCALAPLSDARQICTAGASSVTPPAVHGPAPAACGTFGGWNARLSD